MADQGRPRHRVLLVREGRQAGGGCCGGLDADPAADAGHRHLHRDREAMGAVYRALAAELPRDVVDVQVVDPRNLPFLVPAVLRDARRAGQGWLDACRQLPRGCAHGSIVVDGRVMSHGSVPPPDAAVALVLRGLAAATR